MNEMLWNVSVGRGENKRKKKGENLTMEMEMLHCKRGENNNMEGALKLSSTKNIVFGILFYFFVIFV